jgi:phage terminase large subunit
MTIKCEIAPAFIDLLHPARYKVWYGGRGGAKSWHFARILLLKAYQSKKRILCAREFQSSIEDSVHKLLRAQIDQLGLYPYFTVTKNSITSDCGSEFLFKGLHHNIHEIKSTEGVDICWLEEAQRASEESLELLIPTIRSEGSELWFSLNPEEEDLPMHKRFISNPPPGSIVRKVGWQDNPWFPKVLDTERRYMLATDPEAYQHVWEGQCRVLSNAVIFRNRVSVESFETPPGVRFYHGADWGFANDPCVLLRSFIKDECLYIDYEAFGYGVEIDETPQLFDSIPTAREWPIKADSSRPETISYMRRQGFNIDAAAKWDGCVEDGIAHLKGFKHIYIHERCPRMAQEAVLYKYKVDKVTGDVLPIIVDKNNHGWDSCRYSLDGYITRRGFLGIWEKLAE